MDLREERLDPSVHHLGDPGLVGDLPDRDACRGDCLRSASGGEKFDALFREASGEVDESGLVRDREQGALDFHDGKICRNAAKPIIQSDNQAAWVN